MNTIDDIKIGTILKGKVSGNENHYYKITDIYKIGNELYLRFDYSSDAKSWEYKPEYKDYFFQNWLNYFNIYSQPEEVVEIKPIKLQNRLDIIE